MYVTALGTEAPGATTCDVHTLTLPLWTHFRVLSGGAGFKPSQDPAPSFLTKASHGPGHTAAVNSETLLCACGSPATSYCVEQQS